MRDGWTENLVTSMLTYWPIYPWPSFSNNVKNDIVYEFRTRMTNFSFRSPFPNHFSDLFNNKKMSSSFFFFRLFWGSSCLIVSLFIKFINYSVINQDKFQRISNGKWSFWSSLLSVIQRKQFTSLTQYQQHHQKNTVHIFTMMVSCSFSFLFLLAEVFAVRDDHHIGFLSYFFWLRGLIENWYAMTSFHVWDNTRLNLYESERPTI